MHSITSCLFIMHQSINMLTLFVKERILVQLMCKFLTLLKFRMLGKQWNKSLGILNFNSIFYSPPGHVKQTFDCLSVMGSHVFTIQTSLKTCNLFGLYELHPGVKSIGWFLRCQNLRASLWRDWFGFKGLGSGHLEEL